jgi:two-component system sensor histidine kinase ChiS
MNTITKYKNYRFSIFNRFISLIALAFIILISAAGWKINNLHRDLMSNNLLQATHTIKDDIYFNFIYTESKLTLLASLISNARIENNYNEIQRLLKTLADDQIIKNLYWSSFTWMNQNNMAVVNNKEILKTPLDIGYRNIKSKLFKNETGITKIDINYITKNSITPIALEVKNKEGKTLGSLITTLDLEKFASHIDKIIDIKDVNYKIMKINDNKIIAQSKNFDSKAYTFLAQNINNFLQDKVETKTYRNNLNKYVISKIPNFPFIIIAENSFKMSGYKDYFDSIAQYKTQILLIGLIVGGFIYLFYFSILAPFLSLSETASAISKGNIDIEIPEIHSKEGHLLSSALEKIKLSMKTEKNLVQELSNAHNKLSVTNLRLEKKVNERTEKLEHALLEKTTFLKHLSHEIKIPLQGLNNISENLVRFWDDLDNTKKMDINLQIAHNSKKILSLVSNLLDISAISNDQLNLSLTRVDLSDLVKEIIEECKALYTYKKNINIVFNNNTPFYIIGDRDRLGQVLRNLLVNAIKFSPINSSVSASINHSEITINTGQIYQAVHFMLYDQGEGIKEEELANIFNSFIENKDKKTNPNSGLGLTICQEIIKAHHGKIWAYNNKDGGASFNFTIPIIQPAPQNELTADIPSKNLHHLKKNILMIDDEESCLGSMEMILHGKNYNLIKANSGLAALEFLELHHKFISLIMLDLMMPDMYGLNVLVEIKKNPKLKNIPVILQTSSSDEGEIVKAFEIGAYCFIRKPYKKEEILNEVEHAIKFHELKQKTSNEKTQ